jgi:hypothetical protein
MTSRPSLAGALAACAVLVVAGCAPPAPPPPPPAPPQPTLNGTFRVQLAAGIGDTGAEQPGTAGAFTLVARSACADGGCVATATAPEYDHPNAIPAAVAAGELVFDFIDGRWIAVRAQPSTCREDTGEGVHDTYSWRTYVIEPGANNTWTGSYLDRNALESCGGSTRQALSITRTGDADPGITLPDPAAQPARVTSPAAGLRGQYTSTLTAKATKQVEETGVYGADTTCLRTGDRCLSYLVRDDGPTKGSARKLAFGDGHWTGTSAPIAGECAGGGRYTALNSAVLPLPALPGDPIDALAGSFTQRSTGDCSGTREYDVTYTLVIN